MPRGNDEVAAALQEYAELSALTGGDAFRVRSYQKAAKAIAGFAEEVAAGDVRRVPGVGEAIALKVEEFLVRGGFRQLDELRARVPDGVRRLTKVPSLGPKRAVMLFEEHGIDSPAALAEAIEDGRLDGVPGLGRKTLAKLLKGVEQLEAAGGETHIGTAMSLAERIIATLAAERLAYAGALRRMRETVDGVELLAVAADSIMAEFRAQPYVREVVAAGARRSTVLTASGTRVDLRLAPAASWGAALLHLTGSAAHLAALGGLAAERGWRLTEDGLLAGDRVLAAAEEAEIYAALDLQYVPPPLREGGDEVRAARRGELPVLVEQDDVKGDLHTHTDLTDGVASLAEMVAAAHARGYAYFGVTDHAPELTMQRMTLEKALEQRGRLRELQARYPGMRLLHGTELNIARDGSVDWPAEVLRGFDLCVASVHSHFTQSRTEMTRRFIAACENPEVHVIGHPTTRKIGRRPPVECDWEAVFRAAARTGTAMEIDAYPDRSDLPTELVRLARRHGVKFAVDSDSHAVPHLANLRFGVGIAQRAWLTADDVINTWPLERLLAFLKRD